MSIVCHLTIDTLDLAQSHLGSIKALREVGDSQANLGLPIAQLASGPSTRDRPFHLRLFSTSAASPARQWSGRRYSTAPRFAIRVSAPTFVRPAT